MGQHYYARSRVANLIKNSCNSDSILHIFRRNGTEGSSGDHEYLQRLLHQSIKCLLRSGSGQKQNNTHIAVVWFAPSTSIKIKSKSNKKGKNGFNGAEMMRKDKSVQTIKVQIAQLSVQWYHAHSSIVSLLFCFSSLDISVSETSAR